MGTRQSRRPPPPRIGGSERAPAPAHHHAARTAWGLSASEPAVLHAQAPTWHAQRPVAHSADADSPRRNAVVGLGSHGAALQQDARGRLAVPATASWQSLSSPVGVVTSGTHLELGAAPGPRRASRGAAARSSSGTSLQGASGWGGSHHRVVRDFGSQRSVGGRAGPPAGGSSPDSRSPAPIRITRPRATSRGGSSFVRRRARATSDLSRPSVHDPSAAGETVEPWSQTSTPRSPSSPLHTRRSQPRVHPVGSAHHRGTPSRSPGYVARGRGGHSSSASSSRHSTPRYWPGTRPRRSVSGSPTASVDGRRSDGSSDNELSSDSDASSGWPGTAGPTPTHLDTAATQLVAPFRAVEPDAAEITPHHPWYCHAVRHMHHNPARTRDGDCGSGRELARTPTRVAPPVPDSGLMAATSHGFATPLPPVMLGNLSQSSSSSSVVEEGRAWVALSSSVVSRYSGREARTTEPTHTYVTPARRRARSRAVSGSSDRAQDSRRPAQDLGGVSVDHIEAGQAGLLRTFAAQQQAMWAAGGVIASPSGSTQTEAKRQATPPGAVTGASESSAMRVAGTVFSWRGAHDPLSPIARPYGSTPSLSGRDLSFRVSLRSHDSELTPGQR